MKIKELDLTLRAYSCLEKAGIRYVSQLEMYTDWELLNLPNLGRKALKDIREKQRKAEIRKKERAESDTHITIEKKGK